MAKRKIEEFIISGAQIPSIIPPSTLKIRLRKEGGWYIVTHINDLSLNVQLKISEKIFNKKILEELIRKYYSFLISAPSYSPSPEKTTFTTSEWESLVVKIKTGPNLVIRVLE